MPRAPKAEKPKQRSRAKKPPKAAPVSVTKAAAPDGPRPLSHFDLQFCHIFVQTAKQVEAWRQLRPDDKDPYRAASRMMQRPEIREHIREIYKAISKERQKAAEVSARANLLSLEVADDRLMEIMQQPRKTRAEMLTRDTKTMLVRAPGFEQNPPELPSLPDDATEEQKEAHKAAAQEAREEHYRAQNDALLRHLDAPAPVEDADLLKAIKLTYERKQGIIKADNNPAPTHTTVMLYKPKWFGQQRQCQNPAEIEIAAPVIAGVAHG